MSRLARAERVPTPAQPHLQGWDLLSLSPVRRFLTSPFYPAVFQALSLLLFGLVLYFAFFGTIRPGRNFATVVTWTLWWPLLPLSLFLMGRAWCAVCPITPPLEGALRLARPAGKPGLWLRRSSPWIMAFSFFFLTYVDRVWGFTISPRATGWLLVVLGVGAVALAWRYGRRAFCRYLCPIGALTGLYAMTAVVALRHRGGSCQGCPQLCYRGKGPDDPCPLYEFPRTMDSNRNCNLCGRCLKSCPRQLLGLRLQPPGQELWEHRQPVAGEAVLAVLLIALVFIQTVDMTIVWPRLVQWLLEGGWFGSYFQVLTLTFAGGAALVVAAYLGASWLSARGGPWGRGVAVYGYAYIPLALAAHLGHNSGHLVYEGGRALRTSLAGLASLVGIPYQVNYSPGGDPAFPMPWLAGVVALGAGLSFLVLGRIDQKLRRRGQLPHLWPHWVLLGALSALFFLLFLWPMNPRHSH